MKPFIFKIFYGPWCRVGNLLFKEGDSLSTPFLKEQEDRWRLNCSSLLFKRAQIFFFHPNYSSMIKLRKYIFNFCKPTVEKNTVLLCSKKWKEQSAHFALVATYFIWVMGANRSYPSFIKSTEINPLTLLQAKEPKAKEQKKQIPNPALMAS